MEPNIEIERKYLLRALPPRAAACPSVVIDQGYVPGERIRERVRRLRDAAGTRYVRTVKLGKGLARQEFEEETTEEIFQALWALTRGRRLQKRRYYVPDGDLVWEVDAFLDRELHLAELEIPSEEFRVVVPEWLAPYVVREVTHEKGYGNYSLAR